MELKPPLTYEQQVDRLADKGFIIHNKSAVVNFLKDVNYYRFSAYLLPFKIKGTKDSFVEGIEISRVIKIYEFDSELSALLYKTIGKIEAHIRTLFAYEISHAYNQTSYLDKSLFDKKYKFTKYPEYIQKINDTISRNRNTPVINHHKMYYDNRFPFWVIIEFFSLGMLSTFYSMLTTKNQKLLDIKGYNVGIEQMASWLKCLTELRNRIAHYSRLYYVNFASTPKPVRDSDYQMDRTLFSQIYTLKQLYPSKHIWDISFCEELKLLIKTYSSYIDLEHMGFPPNWEELLTN